MPGERLSGAFADSYPAAADLRTHQYKFCKIVSTGVDVSGAAEVCDGILMNDPNTGQAATVLHQGLAHLIVNGLSVPISVGDNLESAALGIGVKSTVDKKNASAVALDPATVDGAVISVLMLGRRQASV